MKNKRLKMANQIPNSPGILLDQVTYVDGSKDLEDHVVIPFQSTPSPYVVKFMADHFCQRLNDMETGSEYRVHDNSKNIGDVTFAEFQIKIKHPTISDLDQTCYRLARNSNLSLGPQVNIYVDRSSPQKEDSFLQLRAYAAVLQTIS